MIKRRNMWVQVLLMVVTLGIYSIYWFYVTATEMLSYTRRWGSAGLWTFLLFVPFGPLYSYWKYSELVESATDSRYSWVLIFILWLVFPPAVWAITQVELNRLADAQA